MQARNTDGTDTKGTSNTRRSVKTDANDISILRTHVEDRKREKREKEKSINRRRIKIKEEIKNSNFFKSGFDKSFKFFLSSINSFMKYIYTFFLDSSSYLIFYIL